MLNKSLKEILGRETVHPFPARMAPGIALDALDRAEESLRVLDPMMGSGTVIAVARKQGHKAFGVDIDPLAVLISKAWTTSYCCSSVRDTAEDVLDRARFLMRTLSVRDSYPEHGDEETAAFVRYWFDPYARQQLTALSRCISKVRNVNTKVALWCGFSRLIIAKQAGASLALDLAHSRPHKSFNRAPIKPFRKFISAVNKVTENAVGLDTPRGPAPKLMCGDARKLELPDASIDVVLTSPPYLNAIDYMRCSKFSLIWMQRSLAEVRNIRSASIGTEAAAASQIDVRQIMKDLGLRPRLDNRHKAMLARYIRDMSQSLNEVSRVLTRNGVATYVVGENTVRGAYIRNANIISDLAERAGLSILRRQARTLPTNRRYLPPPAAAMSGDLLSSRMRREIILTFGK